MSLLAGVAAALLDKRVIRAAQLVFLDFRDQPARYWLGFGPLKTTDGATWTGLDQVGSIDGLQQATGTLAPRVTLTISAIDPRIMTLAQQQADLVQGRAACVYWQFFDADLALIDAPVLAYAGVMDTMSYRMGGGEKSKVYQVAVAVETIWTNRNRSSAGFYDGQDQAARGFADDTGLNEIPGLAGKTLVWKSS